MAVREDAESIWDKDRMRCGSRAMRAEVGGGGRHGPAARDNVGLAIPTTQCTNSPGPSAVGRVLQGSPYPGER